MAKKRLKIVQPPKADPNVITIQLDWSKLATGHKPHNSGTGVHLDRRKKRQRTRQAAFRAATAD